MALLRAVGHPLPLPRLRHRQAAAERRDHRPGPLANPPTHHPQLGRGQPGRPLDRAGRLHPRSTLSGQPAAPLPSGTALLRLRRRHARSVGARGRMARPGHLHPEGRHRGRLRCLRQPRCVLHASRLQSVRPQTLGVRACHPPCDEPQRRAHPRLEVVKPHTRVGWVVVPQTL